MNWVNRVMDGARVIMRRACIGHRSCLQSSGTLESRLAASAVWDTVDVAVVVVVAAADIVFVGMHGAAQAAEMVAVAVVVVVLLLLSMADTAVDSRPLLQ